MPTSLHLQRLHVPLSEDLPEHRPPADELHLRLLCWLRVPGGLREGGQGGHQSVRQIIRVSDVHQTGDAAVSGAAQAGRRRLCARQPGQSAGLAQSDHPGHGRRNGQYRKYWWKWKSTADDSCHGDFRGPNDRFRLCLRQHDSRPEEGEAGETGGE